MLYVTAKFLVLHIVLFLSELCAKHKEIIVIANFMLSHADFCYAIKKCLADIWQYKIYF